MATRIVDGIVQDVRLAVRRLLRAPIFTTFAVVSLAAGLGVTIAFTAVLMSLFPGAPGVVRPEQVVLLTRGTGTSAPAFVSPGDLDEILTRQTTLSTVAATAGSMQTIRHAGLTTTVPVEAVHGRYFQALGGRMALGRDFESTGNEDAPVVLGYAFWRSRLGSDPNVIGRPFTVGARSYVVVGVAEPSFQGLSGFERVAATAAWIPLATPVDGVPSPRLTVFGRLAATHTSAQANTEIASLARSLDEIVPRTDPDGNLQPRAWAARTLKAVADDQRIQTTPVTVAFAALIVLGLLVACTNLSNLALARGVSRRADLDTRAALGASRWRLIRQECVESAIVATLGALGAVAAIRVLLSVLSRDLPVGQAQVLRLEPTVNGQVLLAAVGALLVAFLVSGLYPALTLTRNLRKRLGAEQIIATVGRGGWILLRWQMAGSTALLLVAAAGVRFAAEAVRHDSGVDLERLATATLRTADGLSVTAADAIAVVSRLADNQGLENVVAATGLPFGAPETPYVEITASTVDGSVSAYLVGGSAGLLGTLGIPILRGRSFDAVDVAGGAPVAVMSRRTARTLFGTEDVVGRDISVQRTLMREPQPSLSFTVVGVSADTDSGRFLSDGYTIFTPLRPGDRVYRVVTRGSDGDKAAAALTGASSATDPAVVMSEGQPARLIVGGPYVLVEFLAQLALMLGGLALLLAMIGLYGVLSQLLAQRTRELGLRMALGATSGRLASTVFRQGLAPVVWGLLLGLGLGALVRLLARIVMDGTITPIDPLAFGVVCLIMLTTGVAACYAPTRRAARTDPSRVLRDL